LQVIINPRQDRPIDLTCKETGIVVFSKTEGDDWHVI
jgi:hypothetical protein